MFWVHRGHWDLSGLRHGQGASHGAPNPSREASQAGALSVGMCVKCSRLSAVMGFPQKLSFYKSVQELLGFSTKEEFLYRMGGLPWV